MDRRGRALAARDPRLHRPGHPAATLRTVEGIYEKAEILSRFPDIGYRYQGRDDPPVRILLYGHYRIGYFVTSDGVKILGVFHGAFDIEPLL